MRAMCVLVLLAACGDDAGTGDAVAIDAEPMEHDAGIDADEPDAAPVALCDRPGLLFCEDFEALALGPAASDAWTTESANGALTIDGEHTRGARALKVSTTGNGRGRLQVAGLTPTANSLWGSAHVWVDAFPTAPDYAHYTLIELAGTGNTTLLRPIGGQYIPSFSAGDPAGSFWGVGSDGGPTGDWTNWKKTVPSEGGGWRCLEFRIDGATDSIDVYIDSVLKPELSVTRTEHGGNPVDFVFPMIDRAWFGWWLYQANPTPNGFDVWFDDLALGSERVGCE